MRTPIFTRVPLNIHIDRRCFGWLYPLVEINSCYHSTSAALRLPTRFGLIDLGDYSSTGNIAMLAAGANAVLVPNKLEFGAVYTTTIASQHDFSVSGMLVKMVYRC